MKPDYVTTGIVPDWGDFIEIKDEDQIQGLRQACQLARHILLMAGRVLKVMGCSYQGFTYKSSCWVCRIQIFIERNDGIIAVTKYYNK